MYFNLKIDVITPYLHGSAFRIAKRLIEDGLKPQTRTEIQLRKIDSYEEALVVAAQIT